MGIAAWRQITLADTEVKNISGKNGYVTALETWHEYCAKRYRIVHVVMLPWQQFWFQYLSALNQLLPFVTL